MVFIINWEKNMALSIEKKMETFQWKAYDEKLKISMDILTKIKDKNPQAQQIYDVINERYIIPGKQVPVNIVESIYKDVCVSEDKIEKEKVAEWLSQYNKWQEKLRILKQEEAVKREQDIRDADYLIENIDNLC